MTEYRVGLWFFAVLVFGMASGCYPGYRMDVAQGNVVTVEQKAQLQLGMSRREVRFVLGSPLVRDPFHANRWDYVYTRHGGAASTVDQQRLSLFFEDDLLVSIRNYSRNITTENTKSIAPKETAGSSLLRRLWNRIRLSD